VAVNAAGYVRVDVVSSLRPGPLCMPVSIDTDGSDCGTANLCAIAWADLAVT